MSYLWRPYVSVAVRHAKAKKEMEKLRNKGKAIQPIELDGRKIASSYWGKGWCDHLESFSDYENRLPRGRTPFIRSSGVRISASASIRMGLACQRATPSPPPGHHCHHHAATTSAPPLLPRAVSGGGASR